MVLIKKYDGLPCETSIVEEDEDGVKYLLLECKINNHSYRFNVNWVKGSPRKTEEEQLDWLAQTYSAKITEAYNDGGTDIKNKLNSNIKNIQDLLD